MQKQFSIGLDCHQATLNGAILDQNGRTVVEKRFDNKARELEDFVAPYSHAAQAVIEASSASLPIYDQLTGLGIRTIVANPLRLHAISDAPVKNDRNDALMLAKLLYANIVPTSYVPPKHIRELRDIVRSYTTLIQQRTQAKNRIRSVLTRHRLRWLKTDIASAPARAWFATLSLDPGSKGVIAANLAVIDALQKEIDKVKQAMLKWKHCKKELELLQTIPGFGPLVSRVFTSEIGEITRFPSPKKLSCYAGLVPGLRASGEKSHNTGIIKASNSALRCAIVQASWPAIRNDPQLRARYDRLKARGKPSGKAIVAIAHHLLCIAYVILTKRTPYRACSKELKGEEAPRNLLEPSKLAL